MKGRSAMHGECGRIELPDKEARRFWIYTYCAHPSGYKLCPHYIMLTDYYKRKYDKEEKQNEH